VSDITGDRLNRTVTITMSASEAYELADFFEDMKDGIREWAPALRSAADRALSREGRRL
jgi:uncharacterized hydantoinase/oxoprolinase family protein